MAHVRRVDVVVLLVLLVGASRTLLLHDGKDVLRVPSGALLHSFRLRSTVCFGSFSARNIGLTSRNRVCSGSRRRCASRLTSSSTPADSACNSGCGSSTSTGTASVGNTTSATYGKSRRRTRTSSRVLSRTLPPNWFYLLVWLLRETIHQVWIRPMLLFQRLLDVWYHLLAVDVLD